MRGVAFPVATTNLPSYPPAESASPYRSGPGKNRRPVWYETQVLRSFLALGLAAVALAGCGAPRASAWVPPPAPSVVAPGPPSSAEPERGGPPEPVPGKVMLGAYLDLSGMTE